MELTGAKKYTCFNGLMYKRVFSMVMPAKEFSIFVTFVHILRFAPCRFLTVSLLCRYTIDFIFALLKAQVPDSESKIDIHLDNPIL